MDIVKLFSRNCSEIPSSKTNTSYFTHSLQEYLLNTYHKIVPRLESTPPVKCIKFLIGGTWYDPRKGGKEVCGHILGLGLSHTYKGAWWGEMDCPQHHISRYFCYFAHCWNRILKLKEKRFISAHSWWSFIRKAALQRAIKEEKQHIVKQGRWNTASSE